MPYKIFEDEPGKWNVWKINESGEKVDKKNNEPYASRKAAMPYFRKLWMVERQDMKANLMLGEIHFEADELNPRILHFKNVVLARPETNKNKDNVDGQGIKELAETIPLMPIDNGHAITKNLGVFTAGRVGEQGELRVDGIVWLDRCQELGIDPQDVLDEKYGLSIEADAKSAECSICHKSYANESQYCEHIKIQGNDMGLRAKLRHGAERLMRGLRAIGGAFTMKPAGSKTGWDPFSAMTFIASHQELEMANELTATEIVELWINSMVAVEKREDVSEADKERAKKEYGDVEFADEKNKKYPLDEKHIHAAWSYINMPKNAAKYSPEELASIKNRIKRAAKKYGMEISEDKKNEEKAAMDKEEEKKETPEEEKKESPEKEKEEKKEDMEAEYSAAKKEMADMMTKMEKANTEKAELESRLQAVQTQLAEAQKTLKAHRVAELKSKFVASIMEEKEFDEKSETLLSLSDDVIELMTRNREKKPVDGGQRMMAETDGTDTVTVKLFRTK